MKCSPGAIEAGLDFIHRAKASMLSHQEFQSDRRVAAGLHGICLFDADGLLASIADINQKCKADGTWRVEVPVRGARLLEHPMYNKSSAFTVEEGPNSYDVEMTDGA